jgi:hypothetical protein
MAAKCGLWKYKLILLLLGCRDAIYRVSTCNDTASKNFINAKIRTKIIRFEEREGR